MSISQEYRLVEFQCKVSSTQEGSSGSYKKDNMFDTSPDTCWNSKQGMLRLQVF